MNAGSLNCPHCGAAASPDALQCPYCHSILQTVACPRCMGMMFAGTKFCPHCGVRTAPLTVSPATGGPCPRCRVPLSAVHLPGADLEQCSRCGGLWMAAPVFDHICSDTESQTAASGLVRPAPATVDERVRYLNCPRCAAQMGRINFARGSGIIMSVCRSHGIWLDRDQLQAIVEFIRSGGMERARRIEKEELAGERRALEFERRIHANDQKDEPEPEM